MPIIIDALDVENCSQESLDIVAARLDFVEQVNAQADTPEQAQAVFDRVTPTD